MLNRCPVAGHEDRVADGRHFHPALLEADKRLPIRALFPYGGFLREHQGLAAGDSVTDRTLGRCWSTDTLVHGSHNFRGAVFFRTLRGYVHNIVGADVCQLRGFDDGVSHGTMRIWWSRHGCAAHACKS